MTATYDPIATTTLGSAASTITFSSIPNTFTDLKLVFVGTSVGGQNNLFVTFNSDSGTNYSWTYLGGNGSSTVSSRTTGTNYVRLTNMSNISDVTPTMRTLDIFSYAGSTNKTVLGTESADFNGSGSTVCSVQLWRNTNAITTITLAGSGNNFAAGTTATLYGIKAE